MSNKHNDQQAVHCLNFLIFKTAAETYTKPLLIHDNRPAIQADEQGSRSAVWNLSGYAQQFVGALKYVDDDNHVKAVLGSHLMEMHLNCNHIKLEFAKRIKKAGARTVIFFPDFSPK